MKSKFESEITAVFNSTDSSSIAEFCREYALKNSKFAKELIRHFLLPKGDTPKEDFGQIRIDVEACFAPPNAGYRPRHKPYLDWNLITHRLYKLTRKGEFWVEHDFGYEAIHMALTILEKVGEMYIEDEVWSDQSYDGNDLSVYATVRLLSKIIDADILSQDLLIGLDCQLNRLNEMEANVDYGIFDFREIQTKLAQKIK